MAFTSRDLLAIYNQETLSYRLSQCNTPITFTGRSLTYTLAEQSQSTAPGPRPPGLNKNDTVAFVIDVDISSSEAATKEAVVGLRVELTSSTDTRGGAASSDAQRPKFISVSLLSVCVSTLAACSLSQHQLSIVHP